MCSDSFGEVVEEALLGVEVSAVEGGEGGASGLSSKRNPFPVDRRINTFLSSPGAVGVVEASSVEGEVTPVDSADRSG